LASKFQQTTNKTLQKIVLKQFEIGIKNADFHAEFKYEKRTENNFSPKSYKQKKGQKSIFLCFSSYKAIFYGLYRTFFG